MGGTLLHVDESILHIETGMFSSELICCVEFFNMNLFSSFSQFILSKPSQVSEEDDICIYEFARISTVTSDDVTPIPGAANEED